MRGKWVEGKDKGEAGGGVGGRTEERGECQGSGDVRVPRRATSVLPSPDTTAGASRDPPTQLPPSQPLPQPPAASHSPPQLHSPPPPGTITIAVIITITMSLNTTAYTATYLLPYPGPSCLLHSITSLSLLYSSFCLLFATFICLSFQFIFSCLLNSITSFSFLYSSFYILFPNFIFSLFNAFSFFFSFPLNL